MKQATLCLIVKRDDKRNVSDVCLAMKKRGFGQGRWNGMGGKVEHGETVEQAMVREVFEESMVDVKQYDKVAELSFTFIKSPDWNQLVHVFMCDEWEGEVQETEEMKPRWFLRDDIPYDDMWPDDKYWLPEVLKGTKLRADFVFEDGDNLVKREVNIVDVL